MVAEGYFQVARAPVPNSPHVSGKTVNQIDPVGRQCHIQHQLILLNYYTSEITKSLEGNVEFEIVSLNIIDLPPIALPLIISELRPSGAWA